MSDALLRAVRKLLGPRVGEGARPRVEVGSERELARLLELVAEHGSSLAAFELSRRRLNQLGTVDTQSSLIEAGAGCLLSEVEERLSSLGLSLGPLSPGILRLTVAEYLEGPHAGLRAIRGGRLEPLPIALCALLADGSLYRSFPAPRSAAGPELDALFLGAGGRAGLVLSALLRVFARPSAARELQLSAPEPSSLVRALRVALSDGVWLSRARLWLRGGSTLAEVRVVGSPESVDRDLETLAARIASVGGRGERAPGNAPPAAAEPHERELRWEALAPELRAGGTLTLHRLAIDTVLVESPEPASAPAAVADEVSARILRAVDPAGLFGGPP